MSSTENYHFHKDCIYYRNCIETEDKIDGHKVIRLWCPKLFEINHARTALFKGEEYNCGDTYDKAGGYPHYPNDLHTVKVECTCFVQHLKQLTLDSI